MGTSAGTCVYSERFYYDGYHHHHHRGNGFSQTNDNNNNKNNNSDLVNNHYSTYPPFYYFPYPPPHPSIISADWINTPTTGCCCPSYGIGGGTDPSSHNNKANHGHPFAIGHQQGLHRQQQPYYQPGSSLDLSGGGGGPAPHYYHHPPHHHQGEGFSSGGVHCPWRQKQQHLTHVGPGRNSSVVAAGSSSSLSPSSDPTPAMTPKEIAIAFVEYYFKVMKEAPSTLGDFYTRDSRVTLGATSIRPDEYFRVTGKTAIDAVFESTFKESGKGQSGAFQKVNIRTLEAQVAHQHKILVQATGSGHFDDGTVRPFVQTVLLCQLSGTDANTARFCVLNDIFVYLDDESPATTPVVPTPSPKLETAVDATIKYENATISTDSDNNNKVPFPPPISVDGKKDTTTTTAAVIAQKDGETTTTTTTNGAAATTRTASYYKSNSYAARLLSNYSVTVSPPPIPPTVVTTNIISSPATTVSSPSNNSTQTNNSASPRRQQNFRAVNTTIKAAGSKKGQPSHAAPFNKTEFRDDSKESTPKKKTAKQNRRGSNSSSRCGACSSGGGSFQPAPSKPTIIVL